MAKYILSSSGKIFRLHNNVNEVKKELKEIADLLGLPVSDCKVFQKWIEFGNQDTDKLHDEFISPTYFPTKPLWTASPEVQ